jgi:hypothetical protein
MPPSRKPDPYAVRHLVAIAALAFALAAPTAYLAQRGFELATAAGTQNSPAIILRSSHVGFHWRALCAGWWGAVVAVMAYVMASRKRALRGSGAPRRPWWERNASGWIVGGLTVTWLLFAWRFP